MQGFAILVLAMSLGVSAGVADEQDYTLLLSEEVMTAKVVTLRDNGRLQIRFNGEDGEFQLDSIRLPGRESNVRENAEKLLRKRLVGKSVEVHSRRSGNGGDVRVGYTLQDGEDVRVELVAQGLVRYCHGSIRERQLERSEREARKTGRGIWSETHNGPVPNCEGPA